MDKHSLKQPKAPGFCILMGVQVLYMLTSKALVVSHRPGPCMPLRLAAKLSRAGWAEVDHAWMGVGWAVGLGFQGLRVYGLGL